MQLILPVKADKQSTEDFSANDAIVTRLGKLMFALQLRLFEITMY